MNIVLIMDLDLDDIVRELCGDLPRMQEEKLPFKPIKMITSKMRDFHALIQFNANLPKQRSEEWYANRKYTIGASKWGDLETFKGICGIIEEKCGLSKPFTGNMYTRFGTFMEPVIQAYVEFKLNTTICEFGSLPGIIDIQTCSPDGVAMVRCNPDITYGAPIPLSTYLNHKNTPSKPVLFEFKCPASRIPDGRVQPGYLAQCLVGAETVPFTDHVLFIEGVFRRCTISDLDYNAAYTPLTRYTWLGAKPIALGIIVIKRPVFELHSTPTQPIVDELRSEYENYADDTIIDFGNCPSVIFDKMTNYVNTGYLSPEYIDIYRMDRFNLAEEYKRLERDPRVIGILPWKLFTISYIPIQRKAGYVKSLEPRARLVMDTINRIRNLPEESRMEAYSVEKALIKDVIMTRQ